MEDQHSLEHVNQQKEIRNDQHVDDNTCCMLEPKGSNFSIVYQNLDTNFKNNLHSIQALVVMIN